MWKTVKQRLIYRYSVKYWTKQLLIFKLKIRLIFFFNTVIHKTVTAELQHASFKINFFVNRLFHTEINVLSKAFEFFFLPLEAFKHLLVVILFKQEEFECSLRRGQAEYGAYTTHFTAALLFELVKASSVGFCGI